MTKTDELKKEVRNTKSISGLIKLRNNTNNTRVVSFIKERIEKLLTNKGYEQMNVSLTTLKNIAFNNTDCNDFSTVEIPKTNRTFKTFAGKKMKLYVNHKTTDKNQQVQIFVK